MSAMVTLNGTTTAINVLAPDTTAITTGGTVTHAAISGWQPYSYSHTGFGYSGTNIDMVTDSLVRRLYRLSNTVTRAADKLKLIPVQQASNSSSVGVWRRVGDYVEYTLKPGSPANSNVPGLTPVPGTKTTSTSNGTSFVRYQVQEWVGSGFIAYPITSASYP